MKSLQNDKNYNCKVTTADGEELLIFSDNLQINDLDQFKEWSCEAGSTQIMIDFDLRVYGGECMNDFLGSAIDGFSLLSSRTICTKDRCSGCTEDLARDKQAPAL